MNDRYRLGGLEDDQLLAALSGLVKRENDSLSELLAHLAELDRRELCVALGYSSLRALISHAEPKGDLLNLMKRGLEALRSELLK